MTVRQYDNMQQYRDIAELGRLVFIYYNVTNKQMTLVRENRTINIFGTFKRWFKDTKYVNAALQTICNTRASRNVAELNRSFSSLLRDTWQ